MMNLLEREKDRYEELIGGMPEYLENSPGEHWADLFMEVTGAEAGQTVLDAGCCSGKGAIALHERGLKPELMDITDAGLVDLARQFPFHEEAIWRPAYYRKDAPGVEALGCAKGGTYDWVYACDVLEHIPTEFVMLSLERLLCRAKRGAFFTISLVPDQFGAFIGQPLHLTVQPYVWWRERIKDLTVLEDSRDFLNTGIYLAKGIG